MSSSSTPIHPRRFTEAIQTLPLPNLHFKAAELCNSIAHLHSSNMQLQPFANEGDHDCAEAIKENVEVMERMEERVILLKMEVERRGYRWSDQEQSPNGEVNGDGEGEGRHIHRNTPQGPVDGLESNIFHGGDEELRRSGAREQLHEAGNDEGEDSLHL